MRSFDQHRRGRRTRLRVVAGEMELDSADGLVAEPPAVSAALSRETDERFRRLVDGLSGAVVAVDIEGRITIVNAATERLCGHRRDELVGHPVEMLLSAIDRDDRVRHGLRCLLAPGAAPMGGVASIVFITRSSRPMSTRRLAT